MADNDLNPYKELVNDVMDMNISDFLALCVERGANASLVTSAISFCLIQMSLSSRFDDIK